MKLSAKFFACIKGVAAALLICTPMAAQAQEGRFVGGGTVYDFSPACISNGGWSGDPEAYAVRFSPSNVGSNRWQSALFFSTSNHSFIAVSQWANFTAGWSPITHGWMSRGVWVAEPGDNDAAQMRITAMWPQNPDETTDEPVRIRGQIRHFSLTRWCTVSFDVIVQQRS